MAAVLHVIEGRQYRLTGGDQGLVGGRPGPSKPNYGGRRAAERSKPSKPLEFDRNGEAAGDDDGPCGVEAGEQLLDVSSVKAEPGGKFTARLSADPELFGFIIGRQGSVKMQIEKEMSVAISVPRKGAMDEDIVISGGSQEGVARAFKEVKRILERASSRKRPSSPPAAERV